MATIRQVKQIMVTNSGSEDSRAIFELQTSEGKKALLQRKSKFDPNVYFLANNSADITSVPGTVSTVLSGYEDAFADLSLGITLTGDGALPASFNDGAEFKNAVFSVAGQSGVATVNGYNLQTGGFSVVAPAAATPATTASTTTQTNKKFLQTTTGKVVLFSGISVVVGTIIYFVVKASKKAAAVAAKVIK